MGIFKQEHNFSENKLKYFSNVNTLADEVIREERLPYQRW